MASWGMQPAQRGVDGGRLARFLGELTRLHRRVERQTHTSDRCVDYCSTASGRP